MTPRTLRSGVIAVKVGMTQDWDHWGVRVPLTVLWIDDCQVRSVRVGGLGRPPRRREAARSQVAAIERARLSARGTRLAQVVQVKTDDVEGYTAVQLGAGAKRAKQLRGTQRGHFEAAGVVPSGGGRGRVCASA